MLLSPLGNKQGPSLKQTWIIFTQEGFVPSLVEIGPVVLKYYVKEFPLFCYYFPLEKGRGLHLNKLEFPSPKDDLCQVWLALVRRFWRRKFLNFIHIFSLFCNYHPLEKGVVLHLNKLESSSPKDTFETEMDFPIFIEA